SKTLLPKISSTIDFINGSPSHKKRARTLKTLGFTYVFLGVLAMYATNYIRIFEVVNRKL
uniref:hypothetical protein n=1 Tax=uncultured Holdemanella sp. TaxID=1763549 RepID=UPI0025DB2CDC